jgi:hypothetical protein
VVFSKYCSFCPPIKVTTWRKLVFQDLVVEEAGVSGFSSGVS